MPKKPAPGRVKRHSVYTPWEAADALGVHGQTVIRWIKHHGLDTDRKRRPWLIDGSELKRFLEARRQAGRTRLLPSTMYCLPCRMPQTPAGRMAEFQLRSGASGTFVGICPSCNRMMHKFLRRADLEAARTNLDVTIRPAVAGIVGAVDAPRTVAKAGARKNHG